MIFPVLPTVSPEFLKPELTATECCTEDRRFLASMLATL